MNLYFRRNDPAHGHTVPRNSAGKLRLSSGHRAKARELRERIPRRYELRVPTRLVPYRDSAQAIRELLALAPSVRVHSQRIDDHGNQLVVVVDVPGHVALCINSNVKVRDLGPVPRHQADQWSPSQLEAIQRQSAGKKLTDINLRRPETRLDWRT